LRRETVWRVEICYCSEREIESLVPANTANAGRRHGELHVFFFKGEVGRNEAAQVEQRWSRMLDLQPT